MNTALTIAGSDSGGGAGIQADLKTFFRFGVFGTSAITAVTAQNTLGVSMWEPVSADLLRAQIDAVTSDLPPAATKSGMIGTVELIEVVADSIARYEISPYVLDPVIIATSGDSLLESTGAEAIRDRLVPLATLVTPNSDEATALTGIRVSDVQSMKDSARKLVEMGAKAALVKGGHVMHDAANVIDVFYDGEFQILSHPRIVTTSTHGTGCTLSAAITALLASDVSLVESVRLATDYVHAAILSAPQLGAGRGPLNHFADGSASTNARITD
ncbi:MAG TPA: bifunctional hydroxymethylpyrimidine kinase/phosphomethylpyrimidine kinase [Gemmatimonadaceae bacterium]|nr:bifunctional hydroxymethylpyrimidine kinase/phosphomethylpyrimidine kinase [Gemmatimonadaceae bacterium]